MDNKDKAEKFFIFKSKLEKLEKEFVEIGFTEAQTRLLVDKFFDFRKL